MKIKIFALLLSSLLVGCSVDPHEFDIEKLKLGMPIDEAAEILAKDNYQKENFKDQIARENVILHSNDEDAFYQDYQLIATPKELGSVLYEINVAVQYLSVVDMNALEGGVIEKYGEPSYRYQEQDDRSPSGGYVYSENKIILYYGLTGEALKKVKESKLKLPENYDATNLTVTIKPGKIFYRLFDKDLHSKVLKLEADSREQSKKIL